MSLYDKASLVQIPSGTKSGTLYSVLPANGDGDFTHTRASSATRVNKDGLIESVASGVPRLDYPLLDGVVQDCPALLLEPTRTNLIQRSEEFDNSYFGKYNTSITPNAVNSPSGSLNADKIVENSANNIHSIDSQFHSATGNLSASVFVKKDERKYIRFMLTQLNPTIDHYAVFDLENKSIYFTSSGAIADIDEFQDDWIRIKISANSTGNLARMSIVLQTVLQSTPQPYQGDGTSGLYLWGAQLEAGSYPTSYIPTTSATVTRSADVCDGAGTSAEFNDSEGVLFAEISALANDGTTREMALSDGGASNRIEIRYVSSANDIQAVIRGAASTILLSYTLSDATEFAKVAVKYKSGDYALWIGGLEIAVSTTTGTPTGLSELAFDDGNGGFNIYGKCKQLMTFNQALTDSELEQITSYRSFDEMATGQLYTVY